MLTGKLTAPHMALLYGQLELDDSSNVVAKLDELGLSENTLVMFTSDNGTMRGIESQHERLFATP